MIKEKRIVIVAATAAPLYNQHKPTTGKLEKTRDFPKKCHILDNRKPTAAVETQG
jgi:hypothetical protein